MAQNDFEAAQAQIEQRRVHTGLVAHYLLNGHDGEPSGDIAGYVASDANLLGDALESTGQMLDNDLAGRVGKLVRAARVINGLEPAEAPVRRSTPIGVYVATDHAAFNDAREQRKRHRA